MNTKMTSVHKFMLVLFCASVVNINMSLGDFHLLISPIGMNSLQRHLMIPVHTRLVNLTNSSTDLVVIKSSLSSHPQDGRSPSSGLS
jgi:hypothetical protein